MAIFTVSSLALIGYGLIVYVLFTLYQLLTSPLRSVPGPFIARFTDLWYLYHLRRGNFEVVNQDLHKKYGTYICLVIEGTPPYVTTGLLTRSAQVQSCDMGPIDTVSTPSTPAKQFTGTERRLKSPHGTTPGRSPTSGRSSRTGTSGGTLPIAGCTRTHTA